MADQFQVKGPDGKSYTFPADATDEEIRAFFQKQTAQPPGVIDIVKDLVTGGAKALGKTAATFAFNPVTTPFAFGGQPQDIIPELQPENFAQSTGGFLADTAVGSLAGGPATGALRNRAANMWHRAAGRPPTEQMSRMAEPVLQAGLGRLTPANARAYMMRPDSLASRAPTAGGRAAEVASINRSYGRGNPNTISMSLIGALTQPGNRAAAAQGIFNAAPAVPVGGGLVYALMQALGLGEK